VICENCSQHCPCTAGIQQCVCVCVCTVGTKKRDGSSQNLCLEVLFHFFIHLKEEQTGSLILWWRLGHGFTSLLKMSCHAMDTSDFIESHKM
jgi:hypothetical protein